MTDMTEYGLNEMPLLKDVLAGLSNRPGPVRIHICSGMPRYWYHRRQIRHVHGTVRYKNGKEAFRSKNVTDEVLGMRVARTAEKQDSKSVYVFVFSPYGHIKERIYARDPDTGTKRWSVAGPKDFPAPSGMDGDDELPF